MSGFSNNSYLEGLEAKALSLCGPNGQQYEFVMYLSNRVSERLEHGQSMDCDEYRALLQFINVR